MNRRNFLKLFGLLTVPSVALRNSEKLKTPERKNNLFIAIDKGFSHLNGAHKIVVSGVEGKRDGKWSDQFLLHGIHVEKNDKVTIETGNGRMGSFIPALDKLSGNYKSMKISTVMSPISYQMFISRDYI